MRNSLLNKEEELVQRLQLLEHGLALLAQQAAVVVHGLCVAQREQVQHVLAAGGPVLG